MEVLQELILFSVLPREGGEKIQFTLKTGDVLQTQKVTAVGAVVDDFFEQDRKSLSVVGKFISEQSHEGNVAEEMTEKQLVLVLTGGVPPLIELKLVANLGRLRFDATGRFHVNQIRLWWRRAQPATHKTIAIDARVESHETTILKPVSAKAAWISAFPWSPQSRRERIEARRMKRLMISR
jgi:hypothetical protein